MIRLLTPFVLAFCLAGPVAAQRTFSGKEAAALRCSNTLALTAVALNRAELIGVAEKNALLGVSLRILQRHVTGTWGQKKAALAVVRDRRSVPDTLEDYQRNADKFFRQFPIN